MEDWKDGCREDIRKLVIATSGAMIGVDLQLARR
jgi:hypothetical protein